MATEFMTFEAGTVKETSLAELASVRLLRSVMTDDGVEVPKGAEGTVVGIWAEGAAYEVEFMTGLATVLANQLEAAALSYR